jgi:hypothetical protein
VTPKVWLCHKWRLWCKREAFFRVGFGWYTPKTIPVTYIYVYLLFWEVIIMMGREVKP